MQKDRAKKMKGTKWDDFYGVEKADGIRKKYTAKRIGITPWNKGMAFDKDNTNHKVVRIEESIEQEVFDIAMPDYHNFCANGVFVHNCWHPDIIEFIKAKQTSNRLQKFNVSVNCVDEFMEQVLKVYALKQKGLQSEAEQLTWDLIFPEPTHPKYKKEWKGDIRDWKAKGYPIHIYKTVKVEWLWNLITQSTYNRNEPGVLFLDRANKFNQLNYAEKIVSTNPSMPAKTKVHTQGGIFDIEKLEGSKFKVKSLDGSLADAECFKSGVNQPLLEFEFGNIFKTAKSAKQHRWPVYDQRMDRIYKVNADKIKIGDLIPVNRNES